MGKIRTSLHSNFYVLFSPNKGIFKIGVTDDFYRRFDSLCRATGEQLLQLFVIRYPPVADHLEFLAHGLFFQQWTGHGEWFNLNKAHVQQLYCLLEGLILNSHARPKFQNDASCSYWENPDLLSQWSIETSGPTRINSSDQFA